MNTGVIIFLIIIFIALLSGVGYYLYTNQHLIGIESVEYLINTKYSKPHTYKIISKHNELEKVVALPFILKMGDDNTIILNDTSGESMALKIESK